MFEYYGNYINDGGTDWWNIAATVFGIVMSTVITITIFWRTNKIERKKEKERLKELEIYAVNSIKALHNPIQFSIESFNTLLTKINDPKNRDLGFKTHLGLSGNSLLWINRADMFKIFITDKKGSEELRIRLFTSLYNKIAMIDGLNGRMHEAVLEKYGSVYNKNLRDYKKHISTLVKDIDTFRGHFKKMIVEPQYMLYHTYFSVIDSFYPDWQKDKDRRLLPVAKKFLNVFVQATKNEVGNEDANSMLRSAEFALVAIANIENNTKAINVFINSAIADLKITGKILKRFVNLASKDNRVSILKVSKKKRKKNY